MPETPLEPAPEPLSAGREVWLKREDQHELGAFKWRGALPALELHRRDTVTASTGNHGAATAWAARELGLRAVVFVPVQASEAKLAILERLGADVRRAGADLDEAKDEARAFAEREGLFFFEDGAEPAQFEGYAAIGREIREQLGRPPAAVVVPVGNGALLAGIGRALRPPTRRIGVAAKEAPVMVESWRAGRPVESDRSATIADGLAVRVAIPLAVEELARAADEMLLVSERELAGAVASFHGAGIRVEPSAAAGLAALSQVDAAGPVVLVVTGRNLEDALLERCLHEQGTFSA
ncbi:MAG TPA: pyridoxal-phosphate dependent enzyme [Gaiellaceae bacterium]|nr:pyridoxal-phosphate dependent enzyme [Gaiellaceae bacterium]